MIVLSMRSTLGTYKKDMMFYPGSERADDEPRPVVETLLRIKIGEWRLQAEYGRTHVTWFDYRGMWVGTGNIVSLDSDGLRFIYIANESHDVRYIQEQIFLNLGGTMRGKSSRSSTICPWCQNPTNQILQWNYTWACRKCHDAINISTRFTKLQRDYLHLQNCRIQNLNAAVAGACCAGFSRRRERLGLLEAEWGNREAPVLPDIVKRQVHERFYTREANPPWGCIEVDHALWFQGE